MTIGGYEIPDILTDIFEMRVFYRVITEMVSDYIADLEILEREIHSDTAESFGVDKREKMMGLSAAPGESLFNRKRRVEFMEFDPPVYTFKALEKWLKSIDSEITVQRTEGTGKLDYNLLTVRVPLSSEFLVEELGKKILAIIPIHMTLDIAAMYFTFGRYSGTTFADHSQKTFKEMKTKG